MIFGPRAQNYVQGKSVVVSKEGVEIVNRERVVKDASGENDYLLTVLK